MNIISHTQPKPAKKLTLNKETVRQLSGAQPTDVQFTPTRDGCMA
jgi:hypothetical protein